MINDVYKPHVDVYEYYPVIKGIEKIFYSCITKKEKNINEIKQKILSYIMKNIDLLDDVGS